jgi:hypothetical protein
MDSRFNFLSLRSPPDETAVAAEPASHRTAHHLHLPAITIVVLGLLLYLPGISTIPAIDCTLGELI